MNETDAQLYKALKFLSTRKRPKWSDEKFNEVFTVGLTKTILSMGYCGKAEGSFVITQEGLEELRKLEAIKLNERSFRIAVAAIAISTIALIVSIFH